MSLGGLEEVQPGAAGAVHAGMPHSPPTPHPTPPPPPSVIEGTVRKGCPSVCRLSPAFSLSSVPWCVADTTVHHPSGGHYLGALGHRWIAGTRGQVQRGRIGHRMLSVLSQLGPGLAQRPQQDCTARHIPVFTSQSGSAPAPLPTRGTGQSPGCMCLCTVSDGHSSQRKAEPCGTPGNRDGPAPVLGPREGSSGLSLFLAVPWPVVIMLLQEQVCSDV